MGIDAQGDNTDPQIEISREATTPPREHPKVLRGLAEKARERQGNFGRRRASCPR